MQTAGDIKRKDERLRHYLYYFPAQKKNPRPFPIGGSEMT